MVRCGQMGAVARQRPASQPMVSGIGLLFLVRVLALAAMLSIPLAGAAPALAFDFFGLFGGGEEDDPDIIDPQRYTVDFAAPNAPADVESAIRNASALWTDRDRPASGAAGLLAKARGDYRRITAALYQHGYYGGTVNILVEGREADALPPDTALPEPATVLVRVDIGPQFRFGNVRFVNQAPPSPDPHDRLDPPSEGGLAPGEVARSGAVLAAEQLLVEAWRRQGYALAEITGREVVADHARRVVDVTLTVGPGSLARVGPVSVTGTENMDPDFVRRQTGLVVGERYHPDDIDRARARLSRLEVFRALRIEAANAVGPDGLLPFEVIVQEQALRRFGVGATFSTLDGLGVEGYWLHRNLFGQAERLRLDARVAGIGYPVETEEFDYFLGGTFTKPGVLTPDTDLIAAISAERTVLPLYTETSATARIGLSHIFTDEITADASAFVEHAQFEDAFGTRLFTTAGILANAVFDNRDSSMDPTEGFYVSGTLEPFYEFQYGNFIGRTVIEGRTYFAFDPEAMFVLAARARAGALLGPDIAEIPPDRLFFAGGGGSVRGYPYRSIGVTGPDGVVTGGRYLLEASLEARVRVTDDIGIVGFVDGGYVAADEFPGLEDLRLGIGAGVRYYTGLGPLRADIAFPLNPREGDPGWALYLGIGQAF